MSQESDKKYQPPIPHEVLNTIATENGLQHVGGVYAPTDKLLLGVSWTKKNTPLEMDLFMIKSSLRQDEVNHIPVALITNRGGHKIYGMIDKSKPQTEWLQSNDMKTITPITDKALFTFLHRLFSLDTSRHHKNTYQLLDGIQGATELSINNPELQRFRDALSILFDIAYGQKNWSKRDLAKMRRFGVTPDTIPYIKPLKVDMGTWLK